MNKQSIDNAKLVDLIELVQGLEIPCNIFADHIKIVCPFHEENTGSMAVYSDHYYCFGCAEHGDQIEFVKKYLKVDFTTAVELLNKR